MLIYTRKQLLWGMLFLFLATAPSATVTAADLVAILVADTDDASIGEATAIDQFRMHREAQKIAYYTGLDLKEFILQETETTPKKVFEVLESLKLQADDVVIFYFSGHGYRTPSKGDIPWPNLFFSRVNQGIEYDRIAAKLADSKPRFILMIADACNSMILDEWAPSIQQKMFLMASEKAVLYDNYRRLFLETSGVVMVTSSEAGEPSWTTGYGSLYTGAFIESLTRAVKSFEPAEWPSILDAASIKVFPKQHPYHTIELGGPGAG